MSSLVADKIIRGCAQPRLAETEIQETWVSFTIPITGRKQKNYTLDLEVLPEQVGQAGAGQATLHNARPGVGWGGGSTGRGDVGGEGGMLDYSRAEHQTFLHPNKAEDYDSY